MLLIRSNNDAKPDRVFVENEEYVKSGGRVPFDMDKLQYIPYSATGYYNSIKSIIKMRNKQHINAMVIYSAMVI